MPWYGSWIVVTYVTTAIYGNNILETNYKKENVFDDFLCIDGILEAQNNTWSKFRCSSYCAAQIHCRSFFFNSNGVCQLHNTVLYHSSNCMKLAKTVYYINKDYLNNRTSFSTDHMTTLQFTTSTESTTHYSTVLTTQKSHASTELTIQQLYTTESTNQVQCDPQWVQLGTGCYKFTPPDNTRVVWTEAKSICTQQGGYLTVIESTEENEVLKEYIAVYGSVDFWMGGSDLVTEGTFIWDHTNQPINLPGSGQFHDWYPPNQPDNGNGGTEQHCMAFYGRGQYQWNDVNCAVTRRFVCEKDPS